jgi:hypothetical protein
MVLVASGTIKHVPQPLRMAIWIYYNMPDPRGVAGPVQLAQLLLEEAIWRYCSMLDLKVADGMKPYVLVPLIMVIWTF